MCASPPEGMSPGSPCPVLSGPDLPEQLPQPRAVLGSGNEKTFPVLCGVIRATDFTRAMSCARGNWNAQRQLAVINHRARKPVRAFLGLIPLSITVSPAPSVIV